MLVTMLGTVALAAPDQSDRARAEHQRIVDFVALSPAACEALGIELCEEDRARPYIEMSGR
jgi:hypothetical protein